MSSNLTYADLVEMCDEQVNYCGKCEHKVTCMDLQKNAIPKPYQYKHIPDASILKKDVKALLDQGRKL